MSCKTCSKCKTEKSTDMFYNKAASSDGKTSACKKCIGIVDKRWKLANKEKVATARSEYVDRNRAKINAACREWQRNNPEKRREMAADWYQRNKARKRETDKIWTEENRDKKNYLSSMYRASKKYRTPNWLTEQDLEIIKALYTLAQQLTESTGISHEVDHIIPMNGKDVSGLHCPLNLQVITKETNRKKYNRYQEGLCLL